MMKPWRELRLCLYKEEKMHCRAEVTICDFKFKHPIWNIKGEVNMSEDTSKNYK